MRNFFKSLLNMFHTPTNREYAEWYLSQSVDRVDLERRMRELDQRGINLYR